VKKEKLSAASKSKLEAETKSNTELIDELIFMTSHSSVDDLDAEKVAAYLETLDERASIDEPLGENEADAWERVLEKTEVGNAISDKLPEQDEQRHRARRTGKILHSVLLAAAFALVLSCVVAFAAGVNPFETVVKVAGDLIFFARNPSGELELPESTETEYRSLREALNDNGMTEAMSPSWIPKDYSLDNITVKSTGQMCKVSALFSANNGNIAIIISNASSASGINAVESEEQQFDDYEVHGESFSISKNNTLMQSVATIGPYDYRIAGNISLEELEIIIQSLFR
jgi:hypothetical protein